LQAIIFCQDTEKVAQQGLEGQQGNQLLDDILARFEGQGWQRQYLRQGRVSEHADHLGQLSPYAFFCPLLPGKTE